KTIPHLPNTLPPIVGITTLFDIHSPHPVLIKDQQYGFLIQTLKFLRLTRDTSSPKVLSSDK
ncbi:hypothetical protein BDZ91DRAFT_784644, partial [Kalaharituber pfeilii]